MKKCRIPDCGISAICGAVPHNIVDNMSVLSALVGAEKARSIVTATGFPSRRAVTEGVGLYDLALAAAQETMSGESTDDFAGVIAVTFSAPDRFPALSVRLAHILGFGLETVAYDIQMACSGYVYGLLAAAGLARATNRKVLLIDGDVQSAYLDVEDVNTLAVMSDAATATIVTPEGPGMSFGFLSDASGADVLRCGKDAKIRMDGFGVFRFVAGPVQMFLKEFMAEAEVTPPVIDIFAPHQANMYMVRQLARGLGLERALITSGEQYANPGSCSIPLTLASHPESIGRLLATGFGAGLSAGAALTDIGNIRRNVITCS